MRTGRWHNRHRLEYTLFAKENGVRVKTLVPLLFFCPVAFSGENSELVERFVSAFNQKDVDAMLEVSAPDIRWMSVSEDRLSIETSTHAELRAAMAGYFESFPDASPSLPRSAVMNH